MTVIYLDVLLCVNIYVDYLLLRTTARLTRSPLGGGRCLVTAAMGSLLSLIILAPELPAAATAGIRLGGALMICTMAFGMRPFPRLMLNTAVFFGANFLFAGAVYGVSSRLDADFIYLGNSVVYADVPLILLIAVTGGLYLIIHGIRLMADGTPREAGCYIVSIRKNGREVRLKGFPDTGNVLVDMFTGRPVIICGGEELLRLTGLDPELKDLPRGFRLLPFSTVSETGTMPVFTPDQVTIENSLTGRKKRVDAMIGLGKVSEAVFDPRLLDL